MRQPLALFLTLALFAPTAWADVFGFNAGATLWSADARGQLGEPVGDARELGLGRDRHRSIYASLEHPLLFLPNVRLAHTQLEQSGRSVLESDFSVGDTVFRVGDSVDTGLDLSHSDATLYYSILDNWVNLDLGLTLRQFDGHARAHSGSLEARRDIDDWLPAAYGQARFDIPLSGWSAGTTAHLLTYEDHHMVDWRGAVSYVIDPLLGLGFEVGYRYLDFDIDESLSMRMTYSGPFASVILRF